MVALAAFAPPQNQCHLFHVRPHKSNVTEPLLFIRKIHKNSDYQEYGPSPPQAQHSLSKDHKGKAGSRAIRRSRRLKKRMNSLCLAANHPISIRL
jgi:hypothetical protein